MDALFEPFQLRRDTLSYDEHHNGILGKYQLPRHGLVHFESIGNCLLLFGAIDGMPPGELCGAYTAFDASDAARLRSPLSIMPAGIIVPTFPRRSRPWLLTTVARGGLGSAT